MTMTQRSRPEATRRTKLQALQRYTASVLACALLAGAMPLVQAQQRAAGQGSRKGKETVTINFVNAEVEAVSRAMAAIVNRQIIVDPRVKGTMTLYSEQPLTQREAFLNYLSALRGLGFAVVEVAGLRPRPSCRPARCRSVRWSAVAIRSSRRCSRSSTRTSTTW